MTIVDRVEEPEWDEEREVFKDVYFECDILLKDYKRLMKLTKKGLQKIYDPTCNNELTGYKKKVDYLCI